MPNTRPLDLPGISVTVAPISMAQPSASRHDISSGISYLPTVLMSIGQQHGSSSMDLLGLSDMTDIFSQPALPILPDTMGLLVPVTQPSHQVTPDNIRDL